MQLVGDADVPTSAPGNMQLVGDADVPTSSPGN
jgi:hypothetical protein